MARGFWAHFLVLFCVLPVILLWWYSAKGLGFLLEFIQPELSVWVGVFVAMSVVAFSAVLIPTVFIHSAFTRRTTADSPHRIWFVSVLGLTLLVSCWLTWLVRTKCAGGMFEEEARKIGLVVLLTAPFVVAAGIVERRVASAIRGVRARSG